MKRSLWVVAFLIVVIGFAGFQQYQSWSLNKPQSSAQTRSEQSGTGDSGQAPSTGGQAPGRAGGRARGETVPVLVATAVQKSVPTQIRAVGNVEAYSTVAIKSQVTGVIYKIHFKEGDDVKKDQLLFTIDPRPFEAAVKQAEANLSRDNAQLVNSREQVKRYAELVDKEYVSKEQYDQIRTNADAAQAVVEADRAAVDNAKVQLSYCYIYAPVSGRVGSFLINEGNLVRVNDGAPLVVINQVSPIFVSFAVPEQYLTALKRHMASGKLLIDASFPSDEGARSRDG
jgi:multidrug efflux system membrane fusion protein